jgi:hypothetical protein
MDLQALYDKVVAALTAAGLTEIEIELKPKTNSVVKLFIACQTKTPKS